MKKVLIAVVLGLFLVTSQAGCVNSLLLKPVPTAEQVKADPVQVARDSVNQTNATIAALSNTVLANYKAGALTKEEKDEWYSKLEDCRQGTRLAKEYINGGHLDMATVQVELAQKVFDELNAYLIKKAAEEKEKK